MNNDKQKICLIIRNGFFYKENYLAGSYGPSCSNRGKRRGKFTNNFFNRVDTYEILIKLLKEKYDIDVFATLYDDHPPQFVEKLKNTKIFNDIFFTKAHGSYQWTTVVETLKNIECKNYDLFLIIRNDIKILKKLALDQIVNYDYKSDTIYYLSKFYSRKNQITDMFHMVPESRLRDYLMFIGERSNKNIHGHNIHRIIHKTEPICKQLKRCIHFENCKVLYTIDGCGCRNCVKVPYNIWLNQTNNNYE